MKCTRYMLFKVCIASDLTETASNTFSTCVVLQYFPSPLTSTSWDLNAESSPWLEKTLFLHGLLYIFPEWTMSARLFFLFQKQPKQRSNSFQP